MTDRQNWWPYLLALLSALMAPSALQHALEPAHTAAVAPANTTPRPSETVQVAPGSEPWLEFLCSYANPKNGKGTYCEPGKAPGAEYMIAGVPDPEATSVPATFDVMVESLIGAAAAEDWRYDRNWLPWGGDRDKGGDSPANPALANDQPGLLLFRKGDRLLLVFLVGETPTSGVNKTALYKAARFILDRGGGSLRILGPRFSGSVPSYKLALEKLQPGTGHVDAHFVTGSATSAGNAEALKPFAYEGTVEHDRRTQALFLQWLGSRAIARNEVAMLSEAGTAFGAALRDAEDNAVLQIEFPYQISRLRNAYEKDPELRALWRDQSAEGKDGKLEWSLASEREDTDRVRTFQGPQTTLLQERQLDQITDQITRRGIRVVGINATDVLDTVFLTLQLRRACPDVRVFTLDSDLLFTYSSGALTFNGMLMVSPYPLWPESRTLHSPQNRSALGVHNAFIRLMGGTGYRDYWSPNGDDRPAVWISAVGRGGLWPLAALNDQAPSQLARIGAVPAMAPWLPAPDVAYWLLFAVLAGLAGYGLCIYTTRRIAELGWLGGDFDPAFFFLLEPPDRTIERTVYVQILCAFGFAAFLPFVVHTGWWLAGSAVFVFLYTTLHEPRRGWALTAAVTFGLPAAIAAPFWLFHLTASPADAWEQFFFNYRLAHPLSGVSPLPSWTLAWFGCAWWAVMRINQLRTREVRAPRLNSWPADEPLLAGLNEAVRRASRTGQVNGFARAFIIALGASLFLLWWTLPEGLWSLESETAGASWANGVYLGMILLTMLLLLTLAQLFDTQTAALDILHALADHPLGDAFAGLPKELAPSALWTRGSNRHPFQSCAHSVKRLRLIPEAAAQGPEAERLLSAALARSAAGHRARSEDIAALHTVLNQIAFALYPALAAKWQKGETADVAAEEFVALRLGALLRHLVMQMRSSIEYLSLGLVLLILTVIAYPFEPQKGLVYMVAAVVAATGFIVVYAVSRIDGHPVMQKFASKEGAPSFLETIRKVAGLGLPPTIATFSALFPGSVRSLSTLVAAASKYVGAQ